MGLPSTIPAILKDAEERMKKSIEITRQELARIRTGRATTALLDGIKVDYYGQSRNYQPWEHRFKPKWINRNPIRRLKNLSNCKRSK